MRVQGFGAPTAAATIPSSLDRGDDGRLNDPPQKLPPKCLNELGEGVAISCAQIDENALGLAPLGCLPSRIVGHALASGLLESKVERSSSQAPSLLLSHSMKGVNGYNGGESPTTTNMSTFRGKKTE